MTSITADIDGALEPAAWRSSRRRSQRRRVVLALCMLSVLGFYLRCSWTYGKDLDPAPARADFQNLQADAFLAGQLGLRIEAPAGLIGLDDPYDATANQQYRSAGLHDLSLYDGKIYAYFGPAPVVLLYIPFRLLRVGELSPTLACLIFCALGFLASVGVCRTVSRRFFVPLSTSSEAIAMLALWLGAPIGWLTSIGRGYEVPIACGYCLVMGGLYFLTRGLFAACAHPPVELALGSLLLAGAVGARPNLFWLFAFIVFAFAYLRWGEGSRAISRSTAIALLAPYAAIGILLAWYNWARFGSIFEFGTSYMLLGENVRLARADEVEFMWRGLFEYLLSPARRRPGFPGLGLRPASFPSPSETSYLREPVAGLLPNMPASLLGIFGVFAAWRSPDMKRRWVALFTAILAGVGLIVITVSSFHFHGVTMRYQMDYSHMLLLASVLGWFLLVQRLTMGTVWTRILQAMAVIVVAWSAFFSIAITTFPCAATGSC